MLSTFASYMVVEMSCVQEIWLASVSCRGAEPQCHQKVSSGFEFYSDIEDGLDSIESTTKELGPRPVENVIASSWNIQWVATTNTSDTCGDSQ